MVVEDRWSAAAALVDDSRRALYEYVQRQGRPVTREEAAAALRISRGLAAFHLDKLVEAGLLRASYQAPSGPRGRGRTPKVYEPARDTVAVTIPERRYEVIAQILADAVANRPDDAAGEATRCAYRHGYELGVRLRDDGPADLSEVLTRLGFEPEPATRRVYLHNCPFHALAQRHTALVCGLNHAYLTGLLAGLEAGPVRADLVPRPGACCVELVRTTD